MEKKSFYKLLTLGVLGMSLLASCEDDAELDHAIPGDRLRLDACLETVGDNLVQTKAPISAWQSTDKLGVFIKQGDISSANYASVTGQVKASYGTQSWALDPAVKLGKQSAYVYAYYPYSETVTNPAAIPVNVTSQTDFLYAGSGHVASSSSSHVTLPMSHALTLFSFNLRKEVGDACTLNSVQIRSAGGSSVIASAGTLDCSTGTITPTAYAPYTLAVNRAIEDNGWTMSLPVAMVFPFTAASPSNAEFVFTINDTPYTVKVPAGMEFARGLRYLFNLTLQGSDLTLDASSITILPWGTGTTVDLSAVELHGPGLVYTLTVAAGSQHTVADVGAILGTLVWGDGATQDYAVGASHTYSSAGSYTVGIGTEYAIPQVKITTVKDLDVLDLSQLP